MTLAEQRRREMSNGYQSMMPAEFTTKVVGVSFRPGFPDNLHRLESHVNEAANRYERLTVLLVREPDNEFDPDAIAVHVPALGSDGHIGYLTAPIARRMASEIDDGLVWSAEVVDIRIHQDHLDRPGIAIRCWRTENNTVRSVG